MSISIGTPFKKLAKKVLLCGSGELGKEVVIELQRYGVEVIAVDSYADAPAMQVADRCHIISMLDGQELKRVIELERPDLVVPEVEAIATDTLAEMEAAGSVTGYSYCPGNSVNNEPGGDSPACCRGAWIKNISLSFRCNRRGISAGCGNDWNALCGEAHYEFSRKGAKYNPFIRSD